MKETVHIQSSRTDGGSMLQLVSHKFVPIYCSTSLFRYINSHPRSEFIDCEWLDRYRIIRSKQTDATVFAFPFGTLMLHIREEREFDDIASLALWRRASYRELLREGGRSVANLLDICLQDVFPAKLSRVCRDPPLAAYVFSFYKVTNAPWTKVRDLETGIALLSEPSVLVPRSEKSVGHSKVFTNSKDIAKLAEAELFKNGLPFQGVSPFGLADISIGCASWAGVAYYALAAERAILESQIVAFEIAIQALWSYCDYITCRLAQKRSIEPFLLKYGVEYLRLCLSRVACPGPREPIQMCLMREAIVDTSRVKAKINEAIRFFEERIQK